MANDFRDMVEADRIIHEPARFVIGAILYGVESADFVYLLHETGLTRGNLSSHLAKLEGAQYVTCEKTFQGKIPRSIYRLTDAGRAAFDTYREQLKRAVETMPD